MKVVVYLNLKSGNPASTMKQLFYEGVDSIVSLEPNDIRIYFNEGKQTTFYSDELIKIEVLF